MRRHAADTASYSVIPSPVAHTPHTEARNPHLPPECERLRSARPSRGVERRTIELFATAIRITWRTGELR